MYFVLFVYVFHFIYFCIFPIYLQVCQPLPPGGKQIALDKYHIIYHFIYHIISIIPYHIVLYHIISYHVMTYLFPLQRTSFIISRICFLTNCYTQNRVKSQIFLLFLYIFVYVWCVCIYIYIYTHTHTHTHTHTKHTCIRNKTANFNLSFPWPWYFVQSFISLSHDSGKLLLCANCYIEERNVCFMFGSLGSCYNPELTAKVKLVRVKC